MAKVYIGKIFLDDDRDELYTFEGKTYADAESKCLNHLRRLNSERYSFVVKRKPVAGPRPTARPDGVVCGETELVKL